MADSNLELPIYLDYQATTPLDPRVLDAMMPWLTDKFGNPHSTTHKFGWEAEDGVEKARAQIAALVNAQPEEIVFTSGATEANNLAVKGVARAYGKQRNHLVTVVTEHKCVLESMAAMEAEGFDVTCLPVHPDGLLDMAQLEQALTDDTLLVSVMAANNEIGVLQDIGAIGALCRARKILFHTDAAQAFGKIPLDVKAMNIDLMSLSGHKIYGPKGIGALYIGKASRVRPQPIMSGGGQERGLRSGTLSPALCVGFGKAAELTGAEMESEHKRLQGFAGTLLQGLLAEEGITLNGHQSLRLPGNVNVCFAGADGERLISGLRDLAVSSGAACASASKEPSYVLDAIGLTAAQAKSALRIGFGRFTSEAEIVYARDALLAAYHDLRN